MLRLAKLMSPVGGARIATITEIHLMIWVWVDAEFNGELNELCGLSISASSPEIFY